MLTKMKSMFIFLYLPLKIMENCQIKNQKELIAGSRVEVSKYKKDPLDFILWKPSES